MTTSQTFNLIGLILDISGVLLLYFFGLSSNVNEQGHTLAAFDIDDDEKAANDKILKKYKLFSRLGISLIVLGFIFQGFANFVGNNKCQTNPTHCIPSK